MGNEVAKPFGDVTMPDRSEMAKRAAESAQNSTRSGAPDGSVYMNFSGKRGVYTIGQEKRKVDDDELWVLNIGSFEDGWVCWKGGKPASTRMANIYRGVPIPAPDPDELGPFDSGRGEGWYQAKGWIARSIDTDQQGYFKINSISGVAEMAEMFAEVSKRLAVGQPCWPVFKYSCEEFEAQGYKNFKPVFEIYGWLDDEAIAKTVEEDFDIDELIAQSGVSAMLDNREKEAASSASEDDTATSEDDAPAARSRRRRRSAA